MLIHKLTKLILGFGLGLSLAAHAQSERSNAHVIIVTSDLQDAGMEKSILNSRSTLRSKFSSLIEFGDFHAAPEFDIQGPFPPNIFHNQTVTADQVLKSASGRPEDILVWFNGHNYSPKKVISDDIASSIDTYKGKLSGRIPWIGDEDMQVNTFSDAVRENKNPNSRWFYLGTTCYSGILHNISFRNTNVCGLSNAPWSKTSLYSMSHGSMTATLFVNAFHTQLADIDENKRISPLEAYINIARYDFINYGQIILSSSAYIDYVTGSKSYAREDRIDYGNNEKIMWERLYAAVRADQITPNKVCGPALKNTAGELLYQGDPKLQFTDRPLFTTEEVSSLPSTVQVILGKLLEHNCVGSKKEVFALENLWKIERATLMMTTTHSFRDACSARDLKASQPQATTSTTPAEKNTLSFEMILKNWRALKTKMSQRIAPIEQTVENCSKRDIFVNEMMAEIDDSWVKSNNKSLSLLPVIVEIKKATRYLTSNQNSLESRRKLQNILQCEGKPF